MRQDRSGEDTVALVARALLRSSDMFSSVLSVVPKQSDDSRNRSRRLMPRWYYGLVITLADRVTTILLPLAFSCLGSARNPNPRYLARGKHGYG